MAVRLALLGGASVYALAIPLAALGCMIIIFLSLATLLVNHAERRAKANGTLTQF